MKRKTGFFGYLILVLLILTILSGCTSALSSKAGELRSENHSVELGSATSAQIRIMMDTGELTISSGSENLLDGTFEYTDPNLRPVVS